MSYTLKGKIKKLYNLKVTGKESMAKSLVEFMHNTATHNEDGTLDFSQLNKSYRVEAQTNGAGTVYTFYRNGDKCFRFAFIDGVMNVNVGKSSLHIDRTYTAWKELV